MSAAEIINISGANFSESEADRASRWVQIPVLFFLGSLAIIGNSAVITQLVRKRLRSRCFSNINFLILQLAISDTLVALFCFIADAAWKTTFHWTASDSACRFVKYMQMFALYTSTYIIVTIGVDRCMAIRGTFSRFNHKRAVKYMSAVAWSLAMLCSIPQLLIFGTQQFPNTDQYQCVTHHNKFIKNNHDMGWYLIFTFCAMFAVPLVLITGSYMLIFTKIRHESGPRSGIIVSATCSRVNSFTSSTAEKRDALMKKAKMKALWVSILVILTFLICWAPYYCSIVFVSHGMLKQEPEQPEQDYPIFRYIFFFGMMNSVLNPIVYGAFHMARRSQSAWRKWNRRFPSTTGCNGLGEPDSYSFVFSPLVKGQYNYSISSRSTLNHVASVRISRTASARQGHAGIGKTPSLDV